jgi:hypothetical protein
MEVAVNIDRIRALLGAALGGLFVALLGMFLTLAGVISMALAQAVCFWWLFLWGRYSFGGKYFQTVPSE